MPEMTWAPAPGDGSVSQATSRTDSDGRASTDWTLGPTLGFQTLNATVPGLAPVQFNADALPETIVQSAAGHPPESTPDSPQEVPVTDREHKADAGTVG